MSEVAEARGNQRLVAGAPGNLQCLRNEGSEVLIALATLPAVETHHCQIQQSDAVLE